jgi:hypothetical protein
VQDGSSKIKAILSDQDCKRYKQVAREGNETRKKEVREEGGEGEMSA